VIEPWTFQHWLRTWHLWAEEINVWMRENHEELRAAAYRSSMAGRLLSITDAMLLYQADVAKHMPSTGFELAEELRIVEDLGLAEPLLVAAYPEGENSPRFIAVVEQVPLAANVEIGRRRARPASSSEVTAGSEGAELIACSLEALVWEPAVSQSATARRTDLAELEDWLLIEMDFTYMMQQKSFREIGVFTGGNADN
jgi:hypothetical protein